MEDFLNHGNVPVVMHVPEINEFHSKAGIGLVGQSPPEGTHFGFHLSWMGSRFKVKGPLSKFSCSLRWYWVLVQLEQKEGPRCLQLRHSGTQQDSQIEDRTDLWNLRVNGLCKGPSREQGGRRNAVGGRVVKNFALCSESTNALGAGNSLLFCSC